MQPETLTANGLNQRDPLTRQPEEGFVGEALSPIDPPDAYSPPGLDRVALPQMHPFLRQMSAEHALLSRELKAVEETILSVRERGFTPEVQSGLLGFYRVLSRDFIPHSRQEEGVLFPLLHARLIEAGEHSKGRVATTAVDLMMNDHITVIEVAAVVYNLLKLAPHLSHEPSRVILQDAALRQARSLVELLRLHIFREDNIVFSAAHRLISIEEFDRMHKTVCRGRSSDREIT